MERKNGKDMISQEYRMRVRGQVSSTARRKALYNHDRIVVDHIQTVDSVEEQSRASGSKTGTGEQGNRNAEMGARERWKHNSRRGVVDNSRGVWQEIQSM